MRRIALLIALLLCSCAPPPGADTSPAAGSASAPAVPEAPDVVCLATDGLCVSAPGWSVHAEHATGFAGRAESVDLLGPDGSRVTLSGGPAGEIPGCAPVEGTVAAQSAVPGVSVLQTSERSRLHRDGAGCAPADGMLAAPGKGRVVTATGYGPAAAAVLATATWR